MALQDVIKAHKKHFGHTEDWQQTSTTCEALCQKFEMNPELELTHVSKQGTGWRGRVSDCIASEA